MTTLEKPRLTLPEARDLTEEVKADAAALWAKLLQLYEGGAHIALGYSSWGEYYAEEFGQHRRTGYKLLDAARVVSALDTSAQLGTELPNESVARELVPVLREDPEEVPEVWGEVVEEYGPAPTAAQVREVVQDRAAVPAAEKPGPQYTTCPTCGHRVRADKPLRARKEES